MLRCRPGHPVAGKGIECLPEASLGVEARMWHRNGIHDQCVPTETFDLEPQSLQIFAISVEGFSFRWSKMKSERKQEALRRRRTALQRVHELLVEDPLVG